MSSGHSSSPNTPRANVRLPFSASSSPVSPHSQRKHDPEGWKAVSKFRAAIDAHPEWSRRMAEAAITSNDSDLSDDEDAGRAAAREAHDQAPGHHTAHHPGTFYSQPPSHAHQRDSIITDIEEESDSAEDCSSSCSDDDTALSARTPSQNTSSQDTQKTVIHLWIATNDLGIYREKFPNLKVREEKAETQSSLAEIPGTEENIDWFNTRAIPFLLAASTSSPLATKRKVEDWIDANVSGGSRERT